MLSSARGQYERLKPYAQSALLPSVLIYVLNAFGTVCVGSTAVYLMEQSICRTHYMQSQPAMVKPGGMMDEEMCKLPEIQSQVARVHGIFKVLNLMPAIFLTGPWGRIAEVLGKRFTLFLNISSITAAIIYFTAVCYFQLPLELIYATPLFDIIGGGTVIMTSFTYSFITEAVEPKDLSGIFYKLTAAQLGISFIGMVLSAYLLRYNVWLLNIISALSLALCIPCTLLYPNDSNSAKQQHNYSPLPFIGQTTTDTPDPVTGPRYPVEIAEDLSASNEEGSSESSSLLSQPSESSTSERSRFSRPPLRSQLKAPESAFNTIFLALTTDYLHSLTIFQDIYNSSPFARTALITYFLIFISTSITVNFVQWASVTFGWLIADVNAIISFEMIPSGAILLSLPYLSRKFLYPRLNNDSALVDIFIVKISVAALAVGLLFMGFAPNKITYIAAITVWTAGIGWTDSLRSFVTSMVVDQAEIDKLYIGIGMIETVASMIGTAGWSAAYAKVVSEGWFVKRILFIVGSSVLFSSLGGMVSLGRLAKSRGRSREI